MLTADSIQRDVAQKFLAAAEGVRGLHMDAIDLLLPALPAGSVVPAAPTGQGIFDHGLE
jgi:2-methylcitrate dehydratase